MKKQPRSPIKHVKDIKSGQVSRPNNDIFQNPQIMYSIPKPFENLLTSGANFLKITAISPGKPVNQDFGKKNSAPFVDLKLDKIENKTAEKLGYKQINIKQDRNSINFKNIGTLTFKNDLVINLYPGTTFREEKNSILLTKSRPLSKNELNKMEKATPAHLNLSEDKGIKVDADFEHTNSTKMHSVTMNDFASQKSGIKETYPFNLKVQKVIDDPLESYRLVDESKSITNVESTTNLESTTVILDSTVVKKNTEPPKKEMKIGDITENEKKKIELSFRTHMSALNKLVQERIRNSNIAGPKPSKPKPANSNDGNNLVRSQTFDNRGKGDFSLSKDPVYEEIWKNLKRFASTKSKYKYRDLSNFDRKVTAAMRSLVGREGSRTSMNFSPKNRNNLNLEDDTDKNGKKARSPDKIKNIVAIQEFQSKRKENTNKVFIIIGGYPDLRQALETRGWIENPDHYSRDFTLKWALKKIDINYDQLQSYQLVNHFYQNITVTTKVGLTRNIKNLIWHNNEDIDEIFPLCYDLNDSTEFDDFVEEFKFGKAVAFVKNYVKIKDSKEKNQLLRAKLLVATEICKRRFNKIEVIIQELTKSENYLISGDEWEILNDYDSLILKNSKYEKLLSALKIQNGIFGGDKDLDKFLDEQAEKVVEEYSKFSPQHSFNQGKNAWIVKPANLSRGRGIACYNDLGNLLEHIKVRDIEWIAQKYIENPLIIKNKKLDIRQWVLVTDWYPMTIWFYQECYVRFSASDYNPDDLNNKYSHLTNNSIGKHSSEFDNSEIEGNMWTCAEFADYLKGVAGTDVFLESIQPQMKKIVIKSLQSVQDMMETRKNSFELFGYDFLIDETFRPWLIEINSSPSMDYSTSVTTRLVKMVMEDTVKVIVDYNYAKPKNKKSIDTGLFKCIFNGKPYL